MPQNQDKQRRLLTFGDERLGLPQSLPLIAGAGITLTETASGLIVVGGGASAAAEFLTGADESVSLPNSRQLLAGANVTFDDTVANARTINVAGGGFDPANGTEFFDDFAGPAAGVSGGGSGNGAGQWKTLTSGTSSSIDISGGTVNNPGVVSLNTGSTAGGVSAHIVGLAIAQAEYVRADAVEPIIYDAVLRVTVLPDGTDDYIAVCGLANAAALTNSLILGRIRFTGAAVRWNLFTRSGGVGGTSTDAVTGPVANTFAHLRLEILTTSVTMFIDGTQVATHATDIPTGALSLVNNITKSVGNANRALHVDMVRVQQTFPVPRMI
jgi:hypothetical protein